ncbi:hypothetical protein N7492_002095 [Penicillium capsulatum]|uniref:Protein kinase domain-containing protein n=1 Tax=Penicillium capsulatum TaxID=69766 RepID=A0A9W9LVC9_9EURO|nr:hypothetical protein N7492_002095 [Penicillium capsulatum]
MHFLNGRQFTILILGIWWALLAYLTPAFPVETALDSFRVSESDNSSSFTPDRALLPRSNLVPQEWKIEKQYRRRLKTAPHDKEPTELIRETVRATREADPRHTKKIIYTVGQTQLVVYSTRVLGKDTYGTVYAGELGPEKKNVAVKETTSATVFRGAALLEKLQKSEYVIQQFEVFQGDSVLQNKQGYFPHGFFQVTQRTAGHLARWIETVGLDEWEKYHQLVVHDCLQGVVDLAAENIAHRDITPEKWYVRMSGAKPKVFLGGFTKAINQPYSSAVETGTFGYVSLGKHHTEYPRPQRLTSSQTRIYDWTALQHSKRRCVCGSYVYVASTVPAEVASWGALAGQGVMAGNP